MIIVKQNKSIINFSKVTEIKIVDNEAQKEFLESTALGILAPLLKERTGIEHMKLSGYGIYAYFEKDNWSVLGEYSTEERAKEVLQEIIDTYCESNEKFISTGYGYVKNNIYEMPED
nr:MAG TPA: hypothetical protein [Caudoviricetes sp.]